MLNNYLNNGFIKVLVDRKPLENGTLVHVEKGKWFRFEIDTINKVEDGYEVICTKLIAVEDKIIK